MKTAIILDLDGVICDTAHFHYLAWHRLAAEYGYELTQADNEQLKGVSRVDSLKFILELANKTLSNEQFETDLHRKNEWYLDLVKDMGPSDTLAGITAFFAEVANRKIPLALGSASKNANMVLTRVGLIQAFDAIVDASQVANGKPHPETIFPPSNTGFVGVVHAANIGALQRVTTEALFEVSALSHHTIAE